MKLTPEKQKKWAMTIVVMGGIIFAVWFFVIQKLQIKEKFEIKESQRLETEAKNRQASILTENKSREQAKLSQEYILVQEVNMPKGNAETWLVKALSDLASKHDDIKITNATLQELKDLSEFRFKDQPYKMVGLQFEFKGDYNQIGTFLRDLENNMPLMEVDTLSITAGSESGPHMHAVTLRVSMVIKS